MSLVGPRPMPLDHGCDQINGWGHPHGSISRRESPACRPLFGSKTTIPFDEMLKLDYLYVTNWSPCGGDSSCCCGPCSS